jgi:hypothetical protein
VLAYDAATNETAVWSFRLPSGWTGTPALVVYGFMASATSGDIDMDCSVMAVTPGDALDLDSATSYDAVNSTDNTVVPAVAGYLFVVVMATLTNFDGGAAGDFVRLQLTRDAVSDTAAGDFYVVSVVLGDGA